MKLDSQRARVLSYCPAAVCIRVCVRTGNGPSDFAILDRPGGRVLASARLASLAWRGAVRELTSPTHLPPESEPILNDVQSLLESGRERVYSHEGRELIECHIDPVAAESGINT